MVDLFYVTYDILIDSEGYLEREFNSNLVTI